MSCWRLPWTSVLHRDIRAGNPLLDEYPDSSLVRPQRFARSRRFAPPHTSRACFISQPRPRFPLQGLVPDNQPTALIAGSCPPDVGNSHLRRCDTTRQLQLPRLQGFAPVANPLLPTSCLSLPTPDPLLSFHSRGFFFKRPGDTLVPPPLMTFAVVSSPRERRRYGSGLQRVESVRPDLLSLEDSPVRDLRPNLHSA